jgi:Tol biopolymer transport system component
MNLLKESPVFKIKILLFLSITLLVIGCNAERVSVSSSGLQGTGASFTSSFSGDGRYVVFASSSAFVVEDTNGTSDIYLHDKLNSTTELISFNRTNSSSGNGRSTEPVISADGRYVAFMSFATDLVQGGNGLNYNVYLRDLQTNTTTLVSDINTGSGSVQFHGNSNPSISADGRFIAFDPLPVLISPLQTKGLVHQVPMFM